MRCNKVILLLITLVLFFYGAYAQPQNLPVKIPANVHGIENHVKKLDGTWQFYKGGAAKPWENETDLKDWALVEVPGELAMQGNAVEHGKPYYYRKEVKVPEVFNSKQLFIRFEGVYNYARVWINGHYVREHYGGFTTWDADVTKFIESGKPAVITVEVTDLPSSPSYGSGYAHHPIGSMLRSVHLFTLPQTHIEQFHLQTNLNGSYDAAQLVVDAKLNKVIQGEIVLSLNDPNGETVWSKNKNIEFTNISQATSNIPVVNPAMWDAEHPNLYSLKAVLKIKGEVVETLQEQVGFREIERQGNQLLVNGKPVKLRGADHHDVSPTRGRSTTRQLDSLDVVMAKKANINFLRTSHYPPSEDLLEFADRYGIYIESESAVCFVGTNRQGIYKDKGNTADDPEYRHWYLGQLAEMVEMNRNHPSVIIWSLGNESRYGSNIQASYNYVKRVDKTRPIIFSYPGLVDEGERAYELLSYHYPTYKGNGDRYGIVSKNFTSTHEHIPMLFDEWAHVPCYNIQTLEDDPNVRNFWGKSLKRFWDNLFWQKGALGGAIWGMIDDTFMLPDTTVGYGEWGIIDVWRRKKPEFWNTKKAYSPVRIEQTDFTGTGKTTPVKVKVYNRFDHTPLSELKMKWHANGQVNEIKLPDIAPHDSGYVSLPRELRNTDTARVQFIKDGRLIDQYNFAFKKERLAFDQTTNSKLEVSESFSKINIKAEGFSLNIDKTNGLISGLSKEGMPVLNNGPYLHIMELKKHNFSAATFSDSIKTEWALTNFEWKKRDEYSVIVRTKGRAGVFPVQYTYSVHGNGELEIRYKVENVPGKSQQVGLKLYLPAQLNRLKWHRKALWSSYPKDHLGRPQGTALKYLTTPPDFYRQKPYRPWKNDTHSYFLDEQIGNSKYRDVPFDFEALKENIYKYSISNSKKDEQSLVFVSGGNQAAQSKVMRDGTIALRVLSDWQYLGLNWGNYEKGHAVASTIEDTVKIKIRLKRHQIK